MVNWMLKLEQAEAAKAMAIFRVWASDPCSAPNQNWKWQLPYRCTLSCIRGFLSDFYRYYAVWTSYNEILGRIGCQSMFYAKNQLKSNSLCRDWTIFAGD